MTTNTNAEDKEAEEYLQQLKDSMEQGQGSYPEPERRDSLLLFVREIINLQDDTKHVKVANFSKEELGLPRVTVRDGMHYARYADIEGYGLVDRYLRGDVKDVSASSLGNKAKLLEIPFTVRRENRNLGTPKEYKKKTLFGSEITQREGMTND